MRIRIVGSLMSALAVLLSAVGAYLLVVDMPAGTSGPRLVNPVSADPLPISAINATCDGNPARCVRCKTSRKCAKACQGGFQCEFALTEDGLPFCFNSTDCDSTGDPAGPIIAPPFLK